MIENTEETSPLKKIGMEKGHTQKDVKYYKALKDKYDAYIYVNKLTIPEAIDAVKADLSADNRRGNTEINWRQQREYGRSFEMPLNWTQNFKEKV